jgi:hypothetical protein
MHHTFPFRTLLAGACVALCLSPLSARAQEKAPARDPLAAYANKRINVDVDSKRLNLALKAIMNSVEADYLVDAGLRDAFVTIHLKEATLDKALKTLMRVSSIPFQYELENGVFHFFVRTEPLSEEKPALEPPKPAQQERIPLENVTATKMFDLLTRQTSSSPVNSILFVPNDGASGALSGRRDYNGFGFNNGNLFFNRLNQLFGLNASSSTGGVQGGSGSGFYFGPNGTIFFHPPTVRREMQTTTTNPRR